ncbi:isoaspartyl peptidase/L-asparaginase [Mesorhizobium sp. KR1-2]|uniref:isoaspartyl peptidase/L-asparaginase family protein n=1 Tax=Mesorhizobium sp. KR1-2 TaxID=3156609 RepID=UPI0032B4B060
MKNQYVLVLHGGAGTISPEEIEAEKAYRDGMMVALNAGIAILERGGSAVDAVVETVRQLEDCPLFNAGHGAVFNEDQRHELDAAVMDGATLRAGAIASVDRIRNPVLTAREVMDGGRSVFLSADGAERFATERGLEMVDPGYFSTPLRRLQLEAVRRHDLNSQMLDHALAPRDGMPDGRFGTVGAVALDRAGHLAAATSTGGMTNKQAGRIGDAPVIGAGTYANDSTCAISATGTGEHFIRACAAHDIHARMKYGNQPLGQAMASTISETITPLGGEGGLIGVDGHGNIAMQFNSVGMYRAWVYEGYQPEAAIF